MPLTIMGRLLWFAWKIVLLQYRKQLITQRYFTFVSCDLLEKSYFCSIANNKKSINIIEVKVVICLKNRTFAVSQTTEPLDKLLITRLWFAWKIVLLQYRKQRISLTCTHGSSCDLLEKSYFCSIANNQQTMQQLGCWLWFAWKIVLLQYRKQQVLDVFNVVTSCDLLEKSYFCSIANNRCQTRELQRAVVICLKNRTFAVSQTTRMRAMFVAHKLWFAWKIVLLQYRKQLLSFDNEVILCCDLLEKSYFCSIANNGLEDEACGHRVVICLKNRTFAVSQTT